MSKNNENKPLNEAGKTGGSYDTNHYSVMNGQQVDKNIPSRENRDLPRDSSAKDKPAREMGPDEKKDSAGEKGENESNDL